MALLRRPAEDESIRDLRRALHDHGGLPSVLRKCATPDELRDWRELLDPDAGRARDVAQPGGFRRQHVRKASPFNVYVNYSLPHLLRPSLQSKMFDSYWSVMDGLFIGDRDAAEDLKFFMENKVTRVVNCSASAIDNHYELMGITYLNYSWSDVETQTILDNDDEAVNETFNFMEEAFRRGEGVLIQSFYGRSRSCCILTAYLMKKYKWSMQTALEYLSFRCPVIGPNDGFLRQLEDFEERLADADELASTADSSTPDEVETGVSCWDEKMLLNTYANCQRAPLSDIQIGKKAAEPKTQKIQFSEDVAEVKPYDVGSMLEDAASADPCDRENRKPATAGKPSLKSALKGAMPSPRSIPSLAINKEADADKDCDASNGSIIIQRKSGFVRCHPNEIVPKRLGIQIHNKTILLEYIVPRYGLRAHHTMQVDLEGPKVPDCKSADKDDNACNTVVANKLQHQHEPWLADVSTEQLAKLVGRLRCPNKPKRCKQQRTSRAPGRSPR